MCFGWVSSGCAALVFWLFCFCGLCSAGLGGCMWFKGLGFAGSGKCVGWFVCWVWCCLRFCGWFGCLFGWFYGPEPVVGVVRVWLGVCRVVWFVAAAGLRFVF